MVWSRNVIDHVRDPVAFAAEAMRVVRPGGRFLLTFDVVGKPSVCHPHPYISESWVRQNVRGRVVETHPLGSEERMVVIEKMLPQRSDYPGPARGAEEFLSGVHA